MFTEAAGIVKFRFWFRGILFSWSPCSLLGKANHEATRKPLQNDEARDKAIAWNDGRRIRQRLLVRDGNQKICGVDRHRFGKQTAQG
jgi:hypothetical protein